MTREQFAGFVSPSQLKLLHDGIRLGLADYADSRNYSNFARLSHTTSIRAQIRNGHMVYRVDLMARTHPDLGIMPKMVNRRRLFYINERARVSLKMLNQDHRHSNYPTSQATAFDAQLWPGDVLDALEETASAKQISLWPDDTSAMVPVTNIVAGYVPNDELETSFQILIICPDGAGNAWEWALTSVDIEELVVANNPAETAAATKIRQRRLPIKVRDGVAKKDGISGPNGQA